MEEGGEGVREKMPGRIGVGATMEGERLDGEGALSGERRGDGVGASSCGSIVETVSFASMSGREEERSEAELEDEDDALGTADGDWLRLRRVFGRT